MAAIPIIGKAWEIDLIQAHSFGIMKIKESGKGSEGAGKGSQQLQLPQLRDGVGETQGGVCKDNRSTDSGYLG